MNSLSDSELTEKIVEKAKSLGAAIAGVPGSPTPLLRPGLMPSRKWVMPMISKP